MKTLGFLGMGNMAKAISGGLIEKGAIPAENIYAYDVLQDKLAETAKEQGFRPCATAEELVKNADAVLVAVKPFLVEAVLSPLKDLLKNKVLLSVAASWDFARYETILDPSTRHLFIMPNTPALVGDGVLLLEETHSLTAEEFEQVSRWMETLGVVRTLPSSLMNIGGSGKMLLETGMHPGQLKDMVCSPKGTTIAGVAAMEEKGARTALIEAVKAAMARY